MYNQHENVLTNETTSKLNVVIIRLIIFTMALNQSYLQTDTYHLLAVHSSWHAIKRRPEQVIQAGASTSESR